MRTKTRLYGPMAKVTYFPEGCIVLTKSSSMKWNSLELSFVLCNACCCCMKISVFWYGYTRAAPESLGPAFNSCQTANSCIFRSWFWLGLKVKLYKICTGNFHLQNPSIVSSIKWNAQIPDIWNSIASVTVICSRQSRLDGNQA